MVQGFVPAISGTASLLSPRTWASSSPRSSNNLVPACRQGVQPALLFPLLLPSAGLLSTAFTSSFLFFFPRSSRDRGWDPITLSRRYRSLYTRLLASDWSMESFPASPLVNPLDDGLPGPALRVHRLDGF